MMSVRVLLVCVYLLSFIYSVHSATLYVSATTGNDTWSGLKPTYDGTDGPVQTLWALRSLLQASTDVTKEVKFLAGTYYLNSSITFSAAQVSNCTWSPYNGGEVRISGGVEVNNWVTVTDANVLNMLPAAARGNVKQASLTALGISKFGSPYRRIYGNSGMELFFADTPMTVARYPNLDPTNSSISNVLTGKVNKSTDNFFQYTDDRPSSWKYAGNDTYMHGYFMWDWSDSVELITYINATDKSIWTPYYNTSTNRNSIGSYGVRAGQRYFYFNLIEELDTPGEYYINRTSGMIYFWPPSAIGANAKTVVSVVSSDMIMVVNAKFFTINGIIFEATQQTAINSNGATNMTVNNCIIRNTGNHGLYYNGGFSNVISNSIFKYTGEHAAYIVGGDRKNLISSNHLVYNNDISRHARNVFTYHAGVYLSGVGITVSHNHIYKAPHNAILCAPGNNHIIEYNEVDNVCEDTGDVGAFYIGRDWTSQGHIIRYNYWHDIIGPGHLGASGVYFDDQNSGALVHGNVFYNVYRSILLGGGRDTTIKNNIFLNSISANVYIDARGFSTSLNSSETLLQRYYAMPTDQYPWNVTYPTLVNLMSDDPMAPKYNYVQNNIYNTKFGIGSIATQALPYFNGSHLIDNNPFNVSDFTSFSGKNFTLLSTAAVFQTNPDFEIIPFSSIGLIKSLLPTAAPTNGPTDTTTSTPGSTTVSPVSTSSTTQQMDSAACMLSAWVACIVVCIAFLLV